MDKKHHYRVGSHSGTWDDLPTDPDELDIQDLKEASLGPESMLIHCNCDSFIRCFDRYPFPSFRSSIKLKADFFQSRRTSEPLCLKSCRRSALSWAE